MAKNSSSTSRRATRDIVVIGASAGGIKALVEMLRVLPHDFPAPIFLVQHLAPHTQSILPDVINMVCPLEAVHPQSGEAFRPGKIYVAPPDHHLLLEDDKVLVTRGPKENKFRPSIDALFRSAAYVFGPRVIGVVLSGYLDDGTSGLWSVKRLGGVAVVQDPADAPFPDMPASVLQFVEVDHVVPIAEMAALLVRLTGEPAPARPKVAKKNLERLEIELKIARHDDAFRMGIIEKGELTAFTCPDCHGALTKLIEGNLIRFRCHTGHSYTISALLAEVTESVESMLYQAMRGLEETNMLLEHFGNYFKDSKQPEVAKLFYQKAEDAARQARVVHDSIFAHEVLSGDIQFRQAKKK